MNGFTLRANAPLYQAPPRFQLQNRQIAQPIIYGAARHLVHPIQAGPRPPFQVNPGIQPMMFGSVPTVPPFVSMYHHFPPQAFFNGLPNLKLQAGNSQSCSQSSYNVSSASLMSDRGLSGSGSASTSSQSSPMPVGSTSSCHGYVAQSTVLYETQPVPSHMNPISEPQNPMLLPALSTANGQEKAPKMHHMLDVESKQLIRWSIDEDPCTASHNSRRIPYDTFFDPAFEPSLHTIFVVAGFDSSETKRIASLEPEIGQRLVGFPITFYVGDGFSPEDVQNTEAQAQPSSDNNESQENSTYELDLHMVMSGIREGIRSPVPRYWWAMLGVREKLILAKRLSARRPDLDKLTGLDFLHAAVELEEKRSELESKGVSQVEDVLKEAHRRLDSYAYDIDPGFGPMSTRECVSTLDFIAGKTIFKGLRWLNWKPVGDTEAFWLCIA